jgi:protease I
MANKLDGLNVAILATDGFEQSELFEPKKALEEAGAAVKIVSLEAGEIKGWNEKNWGDSIAVDLTVDEALAEDFDALQLPGGVMNPDKLRMNEKAVRFIKAFFDAGKPVAAICHAPWTLVEAGVVNGRTVTSWPSVKTDLINAGAKWVDEEVVADNGLVTSRKPQDIPAFNRKMIEEFAEGAHRKQKTATQSIQRCSFTLQINFLKFHLNWVNARLYRIFILRHGD